MEKETLGTLFSDAKEHAQSWFEAKKKVYELKAIRSVSKITGSFAWMLVSLFLLLLFIIFTGLTLGFWLSSYTGSYASGFGIVTLLIVVKIIILAVFRRRLFIDPVIRLMIKHSAGNTKETTGTNNKEQ